MKGILIFALLLTGLCVLQTVALFIGLNFEEIKEWIKRKRKKNETS